MKRRQILTSFCALVGAGGSKAAMAGPSPPISKNSTRCEASESYFTAPAALAGVKPARRSLATSIAICRTERRDSKESFDL